MPMRENTHVVHLPPRPPLNAVSDYARSVAAGGPISPVSMRDRARLDVTQSAGRRPHAVCRTTNGRPSVNWRSVMKKLIAALALVALISVPTLTTSASAQVSPASPTFGSNGY